MPQENCYGIFMFFIKLMSGNSRISVWSIVSCLFWGSLLILFYSLLWRSKKFKEVVGVRGMLGLYVLCIFQLLIPVSATWQKNITLPNKLNLFLGGFHRTIITYDSVEISIGELFLIIWMIGIGVKLISLLVGYARNNRILRKLPHRQISREAFSKQMGVEVPRQIAVYRCTGITVPFSFGIFCKRILIPDQLYTAQELKYIILHERIHLEKGDHYLALLTELLCVIYWWNPCVYLLKKEVEQSLEMRCDSEVTRGMERDEVADYMTTLLTIFRGRSRRGVWRGLSLLGTGNGLRSELRHRFTMLENNPGQKTYALGVRLAVAGFAFLMVLLSNSIVIAPFFLPDLDDLAIGGKGPQNGFNMDEVYFATPDSYIYQGEDGSYYMESSDGTKQIRDEVAEVLIEEGVNFKGQIQ